MWALLKYPAGCVYGLIDPRTDCIKYIGVTTLLLQKRLNSHCSESGHNKRVAWIKKLKSLGLRPQICELERVLDSPNDILLFQREVYWIREFKRAGIELVNGNNGGRGGQRGNHSSNGSPPSEVRQMISEKITALWQDPEYVAMQMETRSKRRGVAPPNLGISPTEEVKQKISNSVKKLWEDEGYRHKQIERHKKKTHCKYGHEFTDENTCINPITGWRSCRTCARERYHAKKMGQHR